MIKVLVTGSGQLAWELQRTAPANVEFIGRARAELDITDKDKVLEVFEELCPDVVINAAAYTAVDKAESDRDAAFAVNCGGTLNIAEACQSIGAYLLHISTDFVFDGQAHRPYVVDNGKNPLGVYGESKSEGEELIKLTMDKHWAIIRTAWVYSSHGNNFVKTMLRLMAEKPALNVVGDQVGTPTWAKGLALVCWAAAEKRIEGIFHWTDAGVASWYDFAVAIQRAGLIQGLLAKKVPVHSIASEDYPTPAKRPSYSVLNKTKLLHALGLENHLHWQDQLSSMIGELAKSSQE